VAFYPTGIVTVSAIFSLRSMPYSIKIIASARLPEHVTLRSSGPLFVPDPSAWPDTSPEI